MQPPFCGTIVSRIVENLFHPSCMLHMLAASVILVEMSGWNPECFLRSFAFTLYTWDSQYRRFAEPLFGGTLDSAPSVFRNDVMEGSSY